MTSREECEIKEKQFKNSMTEVYGLPPEEDDYKAKIAAGIGAKDKKGKPDWSLVDLKNLEGLVRGLEYGAKKYARDNWKKVPDPINSYYAATIRHLSEWWSGEEIDKESHLNHLYHVMCNIYFLIYFTEHAEDVVKE